MLEFYRRINERNPNQQTIVLTALEGEDSGQKALVVNGKLVWDSGTFFQRHREAAEMAEGCKVTVIGDEKVFCEVLCQEKKLVICGGGHVSIPIIRIGLMAGFHVTVLEDRPLFANNARMAGATEVLCESFEKGLQKIEGDKDTFFVIVTRGHRYDQVCLEQISKKSHAYIGMIGSKLRVQKVKEAMLERGCDPEIIRNVYSPIGLRIGAETPEEIAVSIMAEIIQVKNKEQRNCGFTKEIMEAILEKNIEEPKILVTIVGRKGSAPRSIGTKMLVFPDGICAGTVGGGCAEAGILQKALLMLRQGTSQVCIFKVDMTGRDAEEDGMVCGGVIDVLLEPIYP